MAYPTTLDDLDATRGTANDKLSSPNHVTHHALEDAVIEALEAKVGIDGSAVTTSHDYKLSEVTSTDKAVGKTATQTLTNKTLTTPVINIGSDAEGDTYYRTSGGAFTRLARGTDNYIYKMNGNVPNWEAETVTVNASTTINGISELATSAEITAGTATGGTGAALVVTPDALAASTPVFNGSSITGIPVYTVNTDLSNTYFTFEAPIQPSSGSAVPGWTVAGGFSGASGGVGYARLFDVATTILISNSLPGTGSTSAYGYNKIIRFKTRVRFEDTSDVKGFGLTTTAANIYGTHTDTTNGGIRFVLNTSTLYAHNANGTATSTDITSGVTVTNWNVYEIVFNPGVDIKYYVNGTLKATHTTNLPTTGTGLFAIGTSTNGRPINITHPVISIEI